MSVLFRDMQEYNPNLIDRAQYHLWGNREAVALAKSSKECMDSLQPLPSDTVRKAGSNIYAG